MAPEREPRLASGRLAGLVARVEAQMERVTAPLPFPLPPRLERTLEAFRWEGPRGITRQEARTHPLLAEHWRDHVRELEDLGFSFKRDPYRHGSNRGKPWRWVLVAEPTEPPTGSDLPF